MTYFGFQSYSNQGQPFFPFNSYAQYNTNAIWLMYGTDLSTEAIIDYYANLLVMQYV